MPKIAATLALAVALMMGPAALAQTGGTEPYSGGEVTTTTLVKVLGDEGERLPQTGFEAGTLAVWAVVILAIGIVILWLAYRQRAGS